MKITVTLFLIACFFGCNDAKNTDSMASNIGSDYVMSIEIDGMVHNFKTIDWQRSRVEYSEEKIHVALEEVGNRLLVDLHVHGVSADEKHSGSYKIPDANETEPTIYLSFFDTKREGKVSNRRIHLGEGDIHIKQLNKDKLEMTFSGRGSGMFENDKRFDIKGYTNVYLQKQ